jgi:hypothetical protein
MNYATLLKMDEQKWSRYLHGTSQFDGKPWE